MRTYLKHTALYISRWAIVQLGYGAAMKTRRERQWAIEKDDIAQRVKAALDSEWAEGPFVDAVINELDHDSRVGKRGDLYVVTRESLVAALENAAMR